MDTLQCLAADDIGHRVAQEQCRAIVHDNLLSLNNQLAALLLVKLRSQAGKDSIQLRIAIAGAVLRIVTVDIGAPVPVQENLRVAGIGSGDVGNQQVILPLDANLIQQVVVHILDDHINADFLHIGLYRFGIQRQLRPAVVDNKLHPEWPAIFVPDAIAISILPASLIQKLLCVIRVVAVRVLQLVKAVVQGWRYRCAARQEGSLQQHVVVGLPVAALNKGSPDLGIPQKPLLVDTRHNHPQGGNLIQIEPVIILEQINIPGGNIDCHIHLAGLQGHSPGIRVINGRYFHGFKRNLPIPVVWIALHDGFFLHEGLNHIRAGANRAFLGKIPALCLRLGVHDNKQRVRQVSRHVRQRLLGPDNQILPLGSYALILEEGSRPVIFGKGSLDGCLYPLRRQRIAVGELDALPDFKGPGQMVIADAPAFCQPWLDIHLGIKLGEALPQAVSHNHPAKEILGRLQRIGKIGDAHLQDAVVDTLGTAVTTAAGNNACRQNTADPNSHGLEQLFNSKKSHPSISPVLKHNRNTTYIHTIYTCRMIKSPSLQPVFKPYQVWRGSSTSRRASPQRLNMDTTMKIATPG